MSDAYFTITGHIIEETSLITKSICDACVKLLIYSFNFKQQCDNTEKIILENSYLLADKVSPEDDNSVVTNDPLVIESKAIENSIPDLRKKEVENVFNCKDCGRNYRSLNSLRRHLKDHHCRTSFINVKSYNNINPLYILM